MSSVFVSTDPTMAKAKPAPAAADKAHDVPTVSFRIIADDKTQAGPTGVHSEQSRSFGYNDFSDFERPEHYIRFIEPIESELAVQVEYDMDEQDQEWLNVINVERKKERISDISYEVFEILIDKLEKEWFNLIKRIPQPPSHMPVEDSKCAICDDGEGENSNAIVFCDGCNLAVHQDCYGVPYIPEGQWLCRKCTVSPENPVSCLFCPNEGGAFKQTTTGHWSHLLCAIWIPELGVGNAIYMEPVEGVEAVPKNRWKLVCSLCKERVGACIQCEKPSCFTAFHVTCARQAGLLMSMKLMGADGQLKAFCHKHLPAEWRQLREDEEDDDYEDTEYDADEVERASPAPRKRKNSTSRPVTVTTKMARAHAKSYRPGPPIVPQVIVNKLVNYIAKIHVGKKQPFIERLCRYWSLKREARRGAPLLKRLHLEPWTASTESREQTDAEKAKKLEFLVALRNDLEKVRLLAELVRKREKEKLRQAQVIQDTVDSFVFPHYVTLRSVFNRIVAMDREEVFVHPVDTSEVPDYLDVVKEPMCFAAMEDKLDRIAYTSVEEFKRDIFLILDNAMLYNRPETPFHRRAARIKTNAKHILAELDDIPAASAIVSDEDKQVESEAGIGNLESSVLRLQSLLADDPNAEGRDYLRSIFVSEARPKSPSPPPPPAPRERKSRSHQERKAQWEARQAEHAARLSLGGTRATRSTVDGELTITPPPELQYTIPPRSKGKPRRRESEGEPRTRRAEVMAEAQSTTSSPGKIQPMSRPERGVLGLQTIPLVTERERREQERKLDLVTESLDSKDEYARFNVGWILPAGAKRQRQTGPQKEEKPAQQKEKEEVESRKRKAGSSSSPGPSAKRRRQGPNEEEPPAPAVEEPPPAAPPTPPDQKKAAKKKGKGKVQAAGEDPFPPGTQVWAKITSYPHFPAVVLDLDADSASVPQAVLNLEASENEKSRAWLVRFHDKQRSYGWMHEERMDILGTDPALDEMYLAGKERGRNRSAFKSSHVKLSCKNAYMEAKAALQ